MLTDPELQTVYLALFNHGKSSGPVETVIFIINCNGPALPSKHLNDIVGKELDILSDCDFIAEKHHSIRMKIVKQLRVLLADHLPEFLFLLLIEFPSHVVTVTNGPLEGHFLWDLCVL